MKPRLWLLVIGVIGTAAATGCKDQSVRDYLAKDGPLNRWQDSLSKAVCQLEVNNTNGLNPAKRICPYGPGGPRDKTPPPSYPSPR